MDSVNQQKIAWQTDKLPTATKKALDHLAKETWLKRTLWYLAGGTALALQAGHRRSLDLDFFLPDNDFPLPSVTKHFTPKVWRTNIARQGTLYGTLLNAKVSFIAYPFFVPRQKASWYGAVRVLSPRDIAVMKIIAVSQRGRKRDFVDLYWYAKNEEPLVNVLRRLPDQYPSVAHDYHHIIKSLMYFADADKDLMPELYFRANWKTIKRFFQTEARQIAEKLLR